MWVAVDALPTYLTCKNLVIAISTPETAIYVAEMRSKTFNYYNYYHY